MELRQLKYFQLVSRLGSITKAAEEVHVAQPAISISIQKLESELGVALFDRNQKQLMLTSEGQVLARRLDDIFARLHDTVTEINDYRSLQKASIKIGITPIIGAFIFPRLFAEFQKKYPHFEASFVEEGTMSIRKQLEKSELDIGILITSNMSSRLETMPITTGQILACISASHPLRDYSAIPFTELREYPFIMFKEDTYSRKMILEECAKYNFSPRIVFSSSQIETILGLVEQGVGISFLPDTIAYKHANILCRPLSNPLFIQAGLAWNKQRYLSNATRAFIDFVSKSFSYQKAGNTDEKIPD
jgi:DNA-binding transcriptional LysR family regulator